MKQFFTLELAVDFIISLRFEVARAFEEPVSPRLFLSCIESQ